MDDMEMRVWQRVAGSESSQKPSLRSMELRCRESAAALGQLAAGSSGEIRTRLTRLQKQEQANAHTLSGMRILGGEEPEPRRNYPQTKLPLCRTLAQFCRQSQRSRGEYAAWCSDSEYGPVFRILMAEEEDRLRELLALVAMARGQ